MVGEVLLLPLAVHEPPPRVELLCCLLDIIFNNLSPFVTCVNYEVWAFGAHNSSVGNTVIIGKHSCVIKLLIIEAM